MTIRDCSNMVMQEIAEMLSWEIEALTPEQARELLARFDLAWVRWLGRLCTDLGTQGRQPSDKNDGLCFNCYEAASVDPQDTVPRRPFNVGRIDCTYTPLMLAFRVLGYDDVQYPIGRTQHEGAWEGEIGDGRRELARRVGALLLEIAR